jgi:hypothetical protein
MVKGITHGEVQEGQGLFSFSAFWIVITLLAAPRNEKVPSDGAASCQGHHAFDRSPVQKREVKGHEGTLETIWLIITLRPRIIGTWVTFTPGLSIID